MDSVAVRVRPGGDDWPAATGDDVLVEAGNKGCCCEAEAELAGWRTTKCVLRVARGLEVGELVLLLVAVLGEVVDGGDAMLSAPALAEVGADEAGRPGSCSLDVAVCAGAGSAGSAVVVVVACAWKVGGVAGSGDG